MRPINTLVSPGQLTSILYLRSQGYTYAKLTAHLGVKKETLRRVVAWAESEMGYVQPKLVKAKNGDMYPARQRRKPEEELYENRMKKKKLNEDEEVHHL
jgi:hypothetical protein